MAAQCPEIDVILGAHTHHLLTNGEWVDDTLLAAAEKFGHYIGHVQVDVDRMTGQVVHIKAEVFPTQMMEKSEEDIEQVNGLFAKGEETLEVPVFYNPSPLSQRLSGDSPLSSLFGRAY